MEETTTIILDEDIDFIPPQEHEMYELEPRVYIEKGETAFHIRNVNDAILYIACKIKDCTQEQVFALFLDHHLVPIGFCRVGQGISTSSTVSVARLLQCAVLTNATGVILVHNHPTCDRAQPSAKDIETARDIAYVLELVDGIRLWDFIVLSLSEDDGLYCMREDKNLEDNPCRRMDKKTKAA